MRDADVVDLDRLEPGSRADRWEETVSLTHLDVTTTPDTAADPRPFRARIRRSAIEDITILDCTCRPCRGERGRERVAAADGEFAGVLLLHRGTERLTQGDQRLELGPGAAACWDSRLTTTYAVPSVMTKRNVFLPLAAVEDLAGRSWRPRTTVLDPTAPSTRLLLAYLDVLGRDGAGLTGPAATAARNAAIELFLGALAGGPAPLPPAALRAAVDAWIDRRLRRELTPAAIAAAHAVSVRTAHRLYEATGETLSGHIRRRRLECAHEQVAGGGEAFSTIARRWRFASSSHFTRAFRGYYGATPTEVRAAARAGEPLALPPTGAGPLRT